MGEAKAISTPCMACGGSGEVAKPVAYLARTARAVQTYNAAGKCGACNGDGWLKFANRRRD